jgi:mRNA interferase MazF
MEASFRNARAMGDSAGSKTQAFRLPERGVPATSTPPGKRRDFVSLVFGGPSMEAPCATSTPLLVLSPRAFDERTSLVIGLPMTTAPCNATNPFAVALGPAAGAKSARAGYLLCHQPKSFDWRVRGARPHPMRRVADEPFAAACERLNQIVCIG